MEQGRPDDQLRAGEVVELGRDRADTLPKGVTGRVSPHRTVGRKRVEGRHAEELEVVERLEIRAVDHGRSLGLDAERDFPSPRAGRRRGR